MHNTSTWKEEYVESRKDMIYYKYLRSLLAICTTNINSILDVGSGDVDLLSHCIQVEEKYSLDLRHPLQAKGIVGIKEDFLTFETDKKFDVVCCFQVLEHIEKVEKFCQKLLDLASHQVIVSVPYMWKKGKSKYHVQDPVSVEKLIGWFGFEPTFCNIVEGRLIAVFLKNEGLRTCLKKQNNGYFSEFYKDYLKNAASVEHRVPFELMKENSRVVLYGAGERGRKYYSQLRVRRDYEVVLWVDQNYENIQGTELEVYPPDEISNMEYDVILIAVQDEKVAKDIMRNVIALGAIREQLIWIK